MLNRIVFCSSLFLSLSMANAALAADKQPICPADKPTEVATCNDGKVMCSKSDEHRGACSGHGGVEAWADGSAVKSHAKKSEYR